MAIFGTLAGSFEVSGDYPTVRPTLNLNFARSRALDPRITFSRTSVGTYVGRDGLVKTAGNNEPRFDHDPSTLDSLGLMIERERTNLIVYSVINTAHWNTNTSTNTNNTTETKAPDGSNTAFKYVPNNGGTGWVSVYNTANPISLTSGTTYAYSVWAKPTHSDFTGFRINGDIRDGGGINISANFVLSGDGSVSGTYDSAKITKYPNGWYRCEATGTADATTTEEPAFQTSAAGDGTKGFYVWGYQIEVGKYSTSYIPTSGATVTRSVETATINNLEWFNKPGPGTIFIEGDVIGEEQNTASSSYCGFATSNNDNFAYFLTYDNRTNVGFTTPSGGNISKYHDLATVSRFKSAHAWDSLADANTTGTAAIDGDIYGSYAWQISGTQDPNNYIKFGIGRAARNITTHNVITGHVAHISYYPARLTSAQLQQITTL